MKTSKATSCGDSGGRGHETASLSTGKIHECRQGFEETTANDGRMCIHPDMLFSLPFCRWDERRDHFLLRKKNTQHRHHRHRRASPAKVPGKTQAGCANAETMRDHVQGNVRAAVAEVSMEPPNLRSSNSGHQRADCCVQHWPEGREFSVLAVEGVFRACSRASTRHLEHNNLCCGSNRNRAK